MLVKMINRIINKIRRSIYNIKYGKDVIIEGKDIVLKNVEFPKACFIAHNVEIQNCKIGNHSSIGRYTKVRDAEIGSYCSISWDCTIGAPTHPLKTITSSAITYRKEYGVVDRDIQLEQKTTVVGNDVWIGCGSVLISGVSIGDGAVIGAGAVVTKNIPPYEIWGGVPAQKLASRFDISLVERLKRIKWWEWSEEFQKNFIDLFSVELNEDVLSQIENRYQEFVVNGKGNLNESIIFTRRNQK